MKTKTQLKNTNQKLSLAMKRAWKRRREQGTARIVKGPRKAPKKVTQRVTPTPNLKLLLERLEVVAKANIDLHNRLNHVESNAQEGIRGLRAKMLAKPIGPPHVRRAIATHMLAGMLASPPIVDRLGVDARTWARKAYEFADALIEVEEA